MLDKPVDEIVMENGKVRAAYSTKYSKAVSQQRVFLLMLQYQAAATAASTAQGCRKVKKFGGASTNWWAQSAIPRLK